MSAMFDIPEANGTWPKLELQNPPVPSGVGAASVSAGIAVAATANDTGIGVAGIDVADGADVGDGCLPNAPGEGGTGAAVCCALLVISPASPLSTKPDQ